MLPRTPFVLAATLLVLTPAVSRAQSSSLSTVIPNTIYREIRLSPTPDGNNVVHEAHFAVSNPQLYGVPGTESADIYASQIALGTELNRQIGSQLSTFPLGSSAGGFTFTLDPAIGAFSRSSDSFGPLFTQRAFTVGRKRLSLGMNYMRRTYDTFDGRNLRDPELKFYFPHNDCCPGQQANLQPGGDDSLLNPFFEGDVLEAALTVNLDTDTYAFFANYGVTDRFDIGIAVPVVSVDLKTGLVATIVRLSTSANVRLHSFDGQGLDRQEFSDAGSAAGIGDITLRGKLRFLDKPGGGLAVSADLRLPTGNEEDLLGTGATQFTATFIGSAAFGKFAPHVNLGYTFSSDVSDEAKAAFVGAPPDEFDYSFGADVAVTPRVTFAADLIGRSLIDVRRLVDEDLTFRFRTVNNGPDQSRTIPAFATEPGNLNVVLGSVGAKVNLTRTLLFSASVLFSLTDSGLRDAVTPVIGFDYTLPR